MYDDFKGTSESILNNNISKNIHKPYVKTTMNNNNKVSKKTLSKEMPPNTQQSQKSNRTIKDIAKNILKLKGTCPNLDFDMINKKLLILDENLSKREKLHHV